MISLRSTFTDLISGSILSALLAFGAASTSGAENLDPRPPNNSTPSTNVAGPLKPADAGVTQTSNSRPATAKSPSTLAPRGNVEIISQGGFVYDGETGRVIYSKQVKVFDPAEDPKTVIACEWLTTILPPPGGKVGEIIALTNVVITIIDSKGLQIAKGTKATYNATNDTVIVEGNPVVEMPSGTLYGDEKVIYSRATERFEAPGKIRMIARQSVGLPGPLGKNTNSVAKPVDTNSVKSKPNP